MTSNDHDLIKFGRKNYTYINSFLGDVTVRKIISELYPSDNLELVAEQGTGEFEDSMHHILYKHYEKICSVEQGCQNIGNKRGQDCNDTLCQSYSLLNYFIERKKEGKTNQGIKLLYDKIPTMRSTPYWKYEKQMMMINMYHQLINNEKFLDEVKKGLYAPHNQRNWKWKDHTIMRYYKNGNLKPYPQLKERSYPELFVKINELLEEWYEYGFYYYMDKGTNENPKLIPEDHNTPEHRKLIFPLNQPVLGKRDSSPTYSPSSPSSPSSKKSKRMGGKRNKTTKKSCRNKRKTCKNVK
jgi:hypothetical protein